MDQTLFDDPLVASKVPSHKGMGPGQELLWDDLGIGTSNLADTLKKENEIPTNLRSSPLPIARITRKGTK
jgi:hypothetical protein